MDCSCATFRYSRVRPATVQVAERLGVSQARVARIEKRGYDAYTLNTLPRYVQALGQGFTLPVTVQRLSAVTGQDARVHV